MGMKDDSIEWRIAEILNGVPPDDSYPARINKITENEVHMLITGADKKLINFLQDGKFF